MQLKRPFSLDFATIAVHDHSPGIQGLSLAFFLAGYTKANTQGDTGAPSRFQAEIQV